MQLLDQIKLYKDTDNINNLNNNFHKKIETHSILALK